MKWFKHDSNANNDPKLKKVLMKYGADGYALYWYCLELITEPIDKAHITFELEHDAEILANELGIDTLRVEQIMKYFVTLKLFEISPENKQITCMKLAKRLEYSAVKNPALKEIQNILSETIPDNLGQSVPDKTRLDKTRLDKTIKEDTNLLFTEFWLLYPRKENGKKAEITFNRLSGKNQLLAINDIKTRYKNTERKFIPLPTTYLNGERWDDELPNNTKQTQIQKTIHAFKKHLEDS